eukprot:2970763-Karenia_brevis.AAC.1
MKFDPSLEKAIEAAAERAAMLAAEKTMANMGEQVAGIAARKAIEANNAMWEEKLKEIMEVQDTKTQLLVKQSEERMHKVIGDLQVEINELRKVASSNAGSASVAGQSIISQVDGVGATRERHVPNNVEIKGYIADWARRDEVAPTATWVNEWIDKLEAQLPPDAKILDVAASKKLNQGRVFLYRIVLKIKGGGEACWKMKELLQDIWDKDDQFWIAGTRPRC